MADSIQSRTRICVLRSGDDMNGGESSGSWVALLDETQPILACITESEIDAMLDEINEEEVRP